MLMKGSSPRFLDFRTLLNIIDIISVRNLATKNQCSIFTDEKMKYESIHYRHKHILPIEKGGVNARGQDFRGSLQGMRALL